ncbi:MAG: nitroreductase family protein [Bryobacterales bacterium]|nr:nitroreductase family protein [Acidobacteriota bacterium]MCB9384869.1 nitroreductase family protein [Bryobacterales bacterium]
MANDSVKTAHPDHPILPVFAERWSPYVYSSEPVGEDDLRSLFEAARWSASSFNEQPWRYVVARKSEGEAFERLLGCLSEANQAWARHAPVLALGLVKKTFTRNGNPNRVAEHDLGAASAALTAEATARGLHVHQMAGVDMEKAREAIGAPEDFQVVTALAIGYAGDDGEEAHRERDAKPRARKPLAEFVFGADFGKKADWL